MRKSSPHTILVVLYIFIIYLMNVTPVPASANECIIRRHEPLPITFMGNIPTVPVFINGNKINIGVDTGAAETVISTAVSETLHLPRDRNSGGSKIIGVTGSKNVSRTTIEIFGYAGIQAIMKSVPTIAMDTNEQNKSSILSGMSGLLGADILSNYDVEYDPMHKTLTLYTVKNCEKIPPPWTGRYSKGPINILPDNRFTIPVRMNSQDLIAIFDTGATTSCLTLAAANRVGLSDDSTSRGQSGYVTGVTGKSKESSQHTVDEIMIGTEKFHNRSMTVLDFPLKDADMLLGEKYMSHRRFWISYSTRTIFIQSENNMKNDQ